MKKIIVFCLLLSNFLVSNSSAIDSYADLVEPLLPAVVNISVVQKNSENSRNSLQDIFPEEFFRYFGPFPEFEEEDRPSSKSPSSLGSGFIISAEGHIVTNYHVVENAEKITVTLSNKKKLDAKLIGFDDRTDLAVLKVESKTALSFVKFGNSDESRVGDFIIAIGNPFGFGGTVTSGIISAQARDLNTSSGNIIDNFIQTDASINRGNSGGPMFNMKGEVIGINCIIISSTGGNIGLGFAVPANTAKSIIDQLIKNGKVHYGWLGVAIQSTDEIAEGLGLAEGMGALVSAVTSQSPADKAGIEVGDVILKFDGKEISERKKLPRVVAETPIGKTVEVTLMSKGKNKVVSVKVGELDAKSTLATSNKDQNFMGMELVEITPELSQKFKLKDNIVGLLVKNIGKKSVGAKIGIKPGDVIHAINQQPVKTTSDLNNILDSAKSLKRKSVALLIYRRMQIIFLTLPLDY